MWFLRVSALNNQSSSVMASAHKKAAHPTGNAASVNWLREKDSNLRPPVYETGELTLLHPALDRGYLGQSGNCVSR